MGYAEFSAAIPGAVPGLSFNSDGCPDIDAPTSDTLLGLFSDSATDTFAGSNTYAIVLQIDPALITIDEMAVWASVHDAV